MKNSFPTLAITFQNCLDRGCTPEQLQNFIDRSRRQHMDNPEMLRIIDDLEIKHMATLSIQEGVEV